MWKFLFVTLFFIQANAYVPTVESLFRNGSNGDVNGMTVVGSFTVTQKGIAESKKTELMKEMPTVFSHKVLINNDQKNSLGFIQVDYAGGEISNSSMTNVHFSPAASFQSLRLNDEKVEAKFFYALMFILMSNDSDLMLNLISSMGAPVQRNRERIDKEQLYLIGEYIKYLKELEDDGNHPQGLKNPLEGTTPEENEKINEIFNKPFLTPSPLVKREKEGNTFYWTVKTEKFYAKFLAENHKLVELKMQVDGKTVEARCINYILYANGLEFPELIILKDLEGNEFHLTMKNMQAFTESNERFVKRVQDYRKIVESSTLPEPLNKSAFSL